MIELYIVEFPGKRERIFTNVGDAKNCLANMGEVRKGKISHYKGNKVGEIVGTRANNKNIYVYSAI